MMYLKNEVKLFCKKAEDRLRNASKRELFADAFIMAALLLFGFYVNKGIIIKGLYMDDLYMWSCYGEQSFFEYVFPIRTSTRFRPAYWLLAYLEMGLIGTHIELFVPINIIANTVCAILIYFFAKKLSGLRYFGFAAGILGVALIIYTFFTRGGAPSGYATIVIVLCFMSAVLFMLLGIIGEYMSILFREIKDKPIYIVRNVEAADVIRENRDTKCQDA